MVSLSLSALIVSAQNDDNIETYKTVWKDRTRRSDDVFNRPFMYVIE
jgi:hypothetical protein